MLFFIIIFYFSFPPHYFFRISFTGLHFRFYFTFSYLAFYSLLSLSLLNHTLLVLFLLFTLFHSRIVKSILLNIRTIHDSLLK